MKQVQAETGGRPFANDDLVVLQQELLAAVQAQFLNKGAFILSGCYVSGPASGATVSAGIVLLDGQLLRFEGASGVALPAQFQAGAAVLSDPRPYQTGGTKYCMREVPAVLAPLGTSAPGEFIPLVNNAGGKRWEHVQRESLRSPNEVQWLASFNPDDYDGNGRGKDRTEAWGWALCDGRDGRANLNGRVAVGRDVNRSDYDTVGKAGGAESVKLEIPHMPTHDHTGGNSQARFAKVSGNNTTDADMDSSANEIDLLNGIPVQKQGGDQAHENRMPYTVLVARQWVGF